MLEVLSDCEIINKSLDYYRNNIEGEVIGFNGSSQNFFIASLKNKLNEGLLIITSTVQRANDIYEDLIRLVGEEQILLFPHLEILPHESIETDKTIKAMRLKVLESLTNKEEKIIVASIHSLLEIILPPKLYNQYNFDLKVGEEIEVNEFILELVKMGYKRSNMIEAKGEFSIRGGIVDIYPLSFKNPVRMELFGDQIESIREFNIRDQCSIKKLNRAIIRPASEIILPDRIVDLGLKKIKADVKEDALEEEVKYDLERIEEGISFPEIRAYLSYFYQPTTLINYYSGMIIFDNPALIKEEAVKFLIDINHTYSNLLKNGKILPGYQDLFIDFNQFFYNIKDYKMFLSVTDQKIDYIDSKFKLEASSRKLEPFQGKIDLVVNSLKKYLENDYRILIGLSNLSKAKRLKERLIEDELPVVVASKVSDQLRVGNIILSEVNLDHGFVLSDDKFVFYSERELFGRKKRRHRKKRDFKSGEKISSFTDLNPGDYVVHENHGIGEYLGIKTIEVQNRNKDYLLVMYANDDKLYIPTDQINLIQKYVGLDKKRPKLHKLNGNNWSKAKARVKKSVEEMAEELLDLYAKRELKKGYACEDDTVWQKEFEAQFPYEETPDQLEAIEEVKADMESKQPMDRLLCGDVGYGKTEVAIRAIFKMVMEGKQAAFLVPTTILAQQHWNNLSERFSDYPINVAMLSRFRTATEQKNIIEGLRIGTVDVVIGTHRLLSSDIKFKNLGLVVVDEEQRFGVKQKERLKRLKESVDVLTMTATPIPRTLHMSLVGVRDISLIETPPKNRYPIRTYINEYSDQVVKEAIDRELKRNGQVYFVHNRVKSIEKAASKIQSLVPEARVSLAHGQMSEKRLESLMIDFLENKYDVLVCTTIIETGMDIANVNTIIIDDADRFGLSQLYQLRGRVGRTNRIAYAYLLYEEGKVLSQIAEKRLKAIKEFIDLGSGFKIAMRDLELRGAGNILGPEQHGHIAAVGFSLYCKLLEEAVEELKNGEVKETEEVSLDIKINAYLPDDYISDSRQKIEIYKKTESVSDLVDYKKLRNEVRDRFGTIPQVADLLLKLSKVKVLASLLSIVDINEKDSKVNFIFSSNHTLKGEDLINLSRQFSNLKFLASSEPKIEVEVNNLTDSKKVDLIIEVLDFLLY